MSLNTADKDRIEARREQVASLRLRGKSERQIGVLLGVSAATVCMDLKELKRRWREAADADIAEIRARQIAKCEELQAAGWESEDLGIVAKALAQEVKITGTEAPSKTDINLTTHEAALKELE